MRLIFACALAGALISCGPSKEEIERQRLLAVEQARQAEEQARVERENACIAGAAAPFNKWLGASFGGGGELLREANLTNCPGDFSAAYTAVLNATERYGGLKTKWYAHVAREEEAKSSGFMNGACELTGICPAGSTSSPYAEWSREDSQLRDQLADAEQELNQARNRLQELFAAHGFARKDLQGGDAGNSAANGM